MAAAAQTNDPLAEKLITYYRMLAPNAATATEIAAFIRQNPDWPLPTLMERRRQDAIVAEADDATVAALCTEKKPAPTPAQGPALLRCADALANLGHGKEAAALAREAWISVIYDQTTEAAFLRRFPGLITPAEQWTRFQRLAWHDPDAARRQIALLDPLHAAAANARMALKSNILGDIVRPDQDPGAWLDLARAYRRLNQDQAAAGLWRTEAAAAQKAAPDHLETFWAERNQIVRQLLHDGDPADAYEIAAGHGQVEPGMVVEAEFLAGWIALRRLNDPAAAGRHFHALAAASPAVLSQSRAFYWLGRTDAALGADPRPDYARAAAWPMTLYGQLAARAGGESDADLIAALRVPPTPAPAPPATPIMAELDDAARLLMLWSDPHRARPFLMKMVELAAHAQGTDRYRT